MSTAPLPDLIAVRPLAAFFDSLYVVAFYTDQIPLPGGPEQFNGLPGVILGLALPRYYTTWFATKVEIVTPAADELKLPVGQSLQDFEEAIDGAGGKGI